MPVVSITLMKGYDDEVKRTMATRLTDAVRATIAAPLDGITVQIYEVEPVGYMRGRTSRAPGAPVPDGETVVRAFLGAMEARDIDRARAMLDEDFVMTFPGAAPMHRLEELIDWARDRYKSVAKDYDRFDTAPGEDGVVVYCFGNLRGEWLDGRPFGGIRFIDRFTVRDGKIIDQHVWNDMGETLLQESRRAAPRTEAAE